MPRIQNTPRGNRAGSSFTFKVLSTVPTTRYGPGVAVCVSNSTGTMLAINTTGTTWKYCDQTAVLA